MLKTNVKNSKIIPLRFIQESLVRNIAAQLTKFLRNFLETSEAQVGKFKKIVYYVNKT